jgi:predicted GNAT family acetyltransferase
MQPRVLRFDDGDAFAARAGAFLLEREALHNLVYAIGADAASDPPPYLAAVERAGEIVLAAVRTPPHNLVLSRSADPAALEAVARDLLSERQTPPGVHGPRDEAAAFVELWTGLAGCQARARMAQRVHQLTSPTPPEGVAGSARRATAEDGALLRAWATAFVEEALPGEPFDANAWLANRLGSRRRGVLLWEVEGEPVAMSSYTQATPYGVRISGVYTPERLRGNGYASACVAEANVRLLERGFRSTFLFSDLANPTAHRIYERIGYRSMGNVNVHTFRKYA